MSLIEMFSLSSLFSEKWLFKHEIGKYNKEVSKRDKQKEETNMIKEIVKAIFEVLVNGQAVVKELNEL